jgi:putative phosphoesterase
MKIGVISDIHANLPALESVFEAGRVENIKHWYCLGDIVSYYYWPAECIELLREHSVDCIAGNHDRMLCNMYNQNNSSFNDYIKKYGSGIKVALDTLTNDQVDWFCALPEKLNVSIDGYKVLLCHGSPWDMDYYVYPDADNKVRQRMKKTGYDLIFFGHTHYPVLWDDSRVIVVNPGSVGQTRDSKPGACWAIWDTEDNSISLRRETYNYEVVIEACCRYDPDNSYLQNILTRRK